MMVAPVRFYEVIFFFLKAPGALHWTAECLIDFKMSPITNSSLLLLATLLLLTMGKQVEAREEWCKEKRVGSVFYTLQPDAHKPQLPHQCLNNCVYTITGSSSPKFCFQTGIARFLQMLCNLKNWVFYLPVDNLGWGFKAQSQTINSGIARFPVFGHTFTILAFIFLSLLVF